VLCDEDIKGFRKYVENPSCQEARKDLISELSTRMSEETCNIKANGRKGRGRKGK
jgi:hypothetical protein